MSFQFANRASAHLAAPLAVAGTELTLAPGTGDRFPAARPDAPIQVTIVSVGGTSEIVRCHNRAGDVLKDLWRGQENTSVSAFDTGSLVELRLTAEVLKSFLPLGGGRVTGDIDMSGHTIKFANFTNSPFIDNVKTNGLFAPDGNFVGAVQLLSGGVQPRINTYSILTTGILWGAVFLWWGRLDQLPPWLKLCDGSLGTPDLRNRFPLGANNDSDLGEAGGDFQRFTHGAGEHDHGGATGTTQLGSFNLPPLVFSGSGGGSSGGLTLTKIGLVREAIAAGTADKFVDVLTNVTLGGGGGGGSAGVTYSGSAGHAHGIAKVGDHFHLFETVAPYLKLHYVMFRSMQVN
jgi:hypothetical protein